MAPVHATASAARWGPAWFSVTRFVGPSIGLQALLTLGSVIAAYTIVLYVLLPENPLLFFPFMYDDYIALSNTFSRESFLYTRPINHLLEELVTIGGMHSYYVSLNVLTIVNAWLVLVFVFRLNRRTVPLLWSFFYALVVFSASTYVWAGKYNLLSNHGSMLFGILAMFALLEGFERKTFIISLTGVLFFALSIFAKEDYFLPVLCLSLYCLIMGGYTGWKRNSLILAASISVFALLILHTVFIVPFSHVMFNVDSHHIYAQNFSLSSMITTLQTYLLSHSLPTPFLLIVFAVATAYALLVARKPQNYLLVATIFSLFAPYVVLPNHVTGYNAINWLPWMVAFVLVQVPSRLPLTETFLGRRKLVETAGVALVLGLISVSTVALTQQSRASEARFFIRQSTINRTILDSLSAYRPQLDSVDVVGIVGVEGWSPWLKTQAEFLTERGFHNRWVVFVHQDPFYGQQLAFDPYQQPSSEIEPTQPVSFLRLTDLERFPDLPLLKFDRRGRVVAWGIDARDYFTQCISVTVSETTDACEKDFKIKKNDPISGVHVDG